VYFVKRIIVCLILCLNFSIIQSQSDTLPITREWGIKAGIAKGIIAQHRAVLSQLIRGYPLMAEISIFRRTSGKKYWHVENNIPYPGILFSFTDFANPRQLGYSFALAPYLEIPLREKKTTLHLRLCWGLAWLTKKFDIHENQKNIAIGSHLNAYIQFRWFWKIPLSPRLVFEPGFTAMHVSNARFQSPNLGLNILALQTCFNFNFKSHSLSAPTPTLPSFPRQEILLAQTIGWNDYEVYGKKLTSFGTQIQFHYLNKPKHRWMFGADIYYDQNYLQNVSYYSPVPKDFFAKLRGGPKIGYAYNVGNISFPVEMGFYIHQITNPDGLFFHRIGMRYYFPSGWTIVTTLRSHFAVAYCFEFGLGYVIKMKKQ
jgi:hypothetical protein